MGGVNRRRHCGLISDLQELIIRMSESDLNTYKLQLQQVEAALTTDPENEELQQLKTDLEQVLALTQDLINAQLGASAASSSGVKEKAVDRGSNHSCETLAGWRTLSGHLLWGRTVSR